MNPPKHVDPLLRAYFDGKATPDQLAELEDWLREDDANVRLFVDLGLLDGLILSEQKNEDAAAILATLSDADQLDAPEQGHAPLAVLQAPTFNRSTSDDADRPITFREIGSAVGYLAFDALRSKAGAIASIAAVLLLGVVLYAVMTGVGEETLPPDHADNTPREPQIATPPDTPSVTTPVAQLTAEHDAVWDRRPGQDLYAGQRFTLIEGFAQITTHDGAIAILEAPCTIELIDNPNALQLISGKLVGICETDASQGFVVRTPHMDITDLGTRFGVEVLRDGNTEAHVFEGEVLAELTHSTAAGSAMRLDAGQAARASIQSNTLALIPTRIAPFAAALRLDTLPGTGLGLAVGQVDPNYKVIAIDGQTLDPPLPLTVTDPRFYTNAQPNDPSSAQWVSIDPTQFPQGVEPGEVYTIACEIVIDDSVDLGRDVLRIRGVFDNELAAIRINGQSIDVNKSGNPTSYHRQTFEATPAELGLNHGRNTVQLDIRDTIPNTATALNLAWQLEPDTD